jgi:thiol-disulfide isomerase/thioredoxin
VVLMVLALGGRWLADKVRAAGSGLVLQRAMGVVMIATAVAMATQADVRFQNTLAQHLPAGLVNPTNSLERSHAVESRLASLRGKPLFDSNSAQAATRHPGRLPVLGTAPPFREPGRWFNTAPLTMASLRGRVVLIDFWTYTCINCIRTLPYLKAWDARYRKAGLTIVGVHTPEFPFEREAGNVQGAIRADGIKYPVVQDNNYGTWNAYGNNFWPAEYLVDAQGRVRYTHFGEGDYDKDEKAIRTLLAERGSHPGGGLSKVKALQPPSQATPETYVGLRRAQGFAVPPMPGIKDYGDPPVGPLPLNYFQLSGTWAETIDHGQAVRTAAIDLQFQAQRVYVVLSPPHGKSGHVQVLLDGRPIAPDRAGDDVHGGVVTVDRQRLYNVASLPRAGQGHLSLRLDPGLSAYSFTFG